MYGVHVRRQGNAEETEALISLVGSDPEGVWIMSPKSRSFTLMAVGLQVSAANILKQEMLATGGEAAIARGTVNCSVDESNAVMHATLAQYKRLVDKLKIQPFGLKQLAQEIQFVLDRMEEGPESINIGSLKIPSENPIIMGILNVTPDSFSDGGIHPDASRAVEHACNMIKEGADIIDVGAESTRPGAEPVSEEEEWNRLEHVLQGLKEKNVPFSVDTSKGAIAMRALEMGACLINDVTGGADPDLLDAVARHDVGLVVMHMQGTPRTMQENPEYNDVVSEVCLFLEKRVEVAREHGVKNIIIDPGIGFGKDTRHNLELLRTLDSLRSMGHPVLVGVSRKSLLGNLLDLPIDDRLDASLAALSVAVYNGADIVRVHDVQASKRAAVIAAAIRRGRKRA